jgi:uncharacterized protein YgbK (DUF1537 family)
MLTRSEMRIAVIADDLTGAADTGVQLTRAGHRTAVAFGGEHKGLDAVVVDTDSRGLPADEAAARVRAAARQLAGVPILMKKVDSTLRGPLAAEIGAAVEASGRTVAVVAPAYPATGRTTVGGVQLVDGEPVHRTRFAHDPVHPVHEADLVKLLPGARVHDASSEEDLERVVRSVGDPSSVLWVGSAGLAAALAAVYPGDHDADEPEEEPAGGPVLVVVGSANDTAREQIARLTAEGVPAVVMPIDGRDVSVAVVDALESHGVCVLHPARRSGDPARIAAALAEKAARATRGNPVCGLAHTGGDTASRF